MIYKNDTILFYYKRDNYNDLQEWYNLALLSTTIIMVYKSYKNNTVWSLWCLYFFTFNIKW